MGPVSAKALPTRVGNQVYGPRKRQSPDGLWACFVGLHDL